jgi:hypothetical protein
MPEPIQCTQPSPIPTSEDTSMLPGSEGPISTLGLVDAPTPLSDLARDCADKAAGMVLAASTTGRHPAIVALVALKAGFELADCVNDELHKADIDATIIECTNRGGSPVGVLEHSVSCQGMKR